MTNPSFDRNIIQLFKSFYLNISNFVKIFQIKYGTPYFDRNIIQLFKIIV